MPIFEHCMWYIKLFQQIIVDFALADLKQEEEEKAAHKKQVLAERIEPLEENYCLEDMVECMCSFLLCFSLPCLPPSFSSSYSFPTFNYPAWECKCYTVGL